MKPIFSKNIHKYLLMGVAVLGSGGLLTLALVAYYLHPNFIEVGYRPKQPVPYSHALHAGELGIDCRYCHSSVEKAASAGVPSTQTCMNCHTLIKANSPKLAPVRKSWEEGVALQWTKVHDLPDYVQFNHGVHIEAQIGCASCHGDIANMEVVQKVETLTMGWCLDCHRNPSKHVRPKAEIYNTSWMPGDDHEIFLKSYFEKKKLKGPENCTACHY